MDIRPFDDIDAFERLETRCFDAPWTRAMIEAELAHDYAHYFAVFADEKPVAYAGVQIILDEGHITNIACDPDFRRRGYASALVEYLIGIAEKRRLRYLTLEVRESNTAAAELYAKYGFLLWGTRRNYYTKPRENALLMTLDFTKREKP